MITTTVLTNGESIDRGGKGEEGREEGEKIRKKRRVGVCDCVITV